MKNVEIEYLNASSYYALLITLSTDSPINIIRKYENENGFKCSGKILIDNILHSGNNSNRFIELSCENGKINYNSISFVQIDRKNELRIKANNILRKYPYIIKNSILNDSQKNLLLHGISI